MNMLKLESIKADLKKNEVTLSYIAKLQNDKNTWSVVHPQTAGIQCYMNELDKSMMLAEIRDGYNFTYFMIDKSTLDLITDSDLTSDGVTVANMFARNNLINEFKYYHLDKQIEYGYTDEWL